MSDGGFRVTCKKDFSQTIEIRRERVNNNDVTINCATPFYLDSGNETGTNLVNYLSEKPVQKLVVQSCSFSGDALQDIVFEIVKQLEDLQQLTVIDVKLRHNLPDDIVRGKRHLEHFEFRNVMPNQVSILSTSYWKLFHMKVLFTAFL